MLTTKQVRKLVVLVVGGTVLLFGILLIVLPGPSSLVIPAGLAILATEFVWAQRLLAKVRKAMADAATLVTGKKRPADK